jgi:hypothetical protein
MPGGEDAGPPPDVFDYGGAGPWFHEDDQHGWVFAEDGVRLIYRRLGIDSPDEFVFQHA